MELRICLDVHDMDLAVDFYTRGLGLRSGRRFKSDFVELLGAGSPIDLLLNADGTQAVAVAGTGDEGPHTRRDYRRHWTPLHLDFVVDDIDAAVARLTGLGAVLETPVTDRAWGRIAGLADPFGHGFDLLQFIGRGYDELIDPA